MVENVLVPVVVSNGARVRDASVLATCSVESKSCLLNSVTSDINPPSLAKTT
jgi:hypothetical protein